MFRRNISSKLRCHYPYSHQRGKHTVVVSPAVSQVASAAAAETSKFQIYLSTTNDPYLNLSIEHHLLQVTPVDSTVLFLYANRPCVVIGRNQNPWLETNLRLLSLPWPSPESSREASLAGDQFSDASLTRAELVRRRSGGGTVFHGPGNVNYSVICPSEVFTRDKHALMVASALQSMNHTAHVNSRHDIVISSGELHQTPTSHESPPAGVSSSNPSSAAVAASMRPSHRKISGSAYKLTRGRALHHGTCLLCTPHLTSLSKLLSSPARGFLEARGVDSVRSPVANVLPAATDAETLAGHTARFYNLVIRAFASLYPAAALAQADIQSIEDTAYRASDTELLHLHSDTIAAFVGDGLATLPKIRDGMAELRSEEWLFGQTPRFTLRFPASAEKLAQSVDDGSALSHRDTQSTTSQPHDLLVYLSARHGIVDDTALCKASSAASGEQGALRGLDEQTRGQEPEQGTLGAVLKGRTLWTMTEQDWAEATHKASKFSRSAAQDGVEDVIEEVQQRHLAAWFTKMLPLPRRPVA